MLCRASWSPRAAGVNMTLRTLGFEVILSCGQGAPLVYSLASLQEFVQSLHLWFRFFICQAEEDLLGECELVDKRFVLNIP